MNKFLERLNSGEILVADGATGSNLQKMGLKPGKPPEDLIIDDPDTILKLASSFAQAGSDIILTCTFGGTRMRMKDSKYQDRTPEVNIRAAEIARKAASLNGGLVAGSMGPIGALVKPYGPVDADDVKATFAEQAKALADGGVDLLLIETMFSFEETTAAFEGARSTTDLPIVISFSYDRGTRTMMGLEPGNVARELTSLGVDVVGVNCGKSLDDNLANLRAARAATTLPIWMKPNAGLPTMSGVSESHYDVTPEMMGAAAEHWVAEGANICGGCCGTSPEHLRHIAQAATLERQA